MDSGPSPAGQSHGKHSRKQVPRRSHASPGRLDRDPLPLIRQASAGRVSTLLPLRYGRMLQSPFTFFRGNALLQAHDLAGTPDMGLHVPVCGDAHLMNFGGFATPERNMIFGPTDFDEAYVGPWEWDLKRLCTSLVVAARQLGHGEDVGREAVMAAASSYQIRMGEYAQMGVLESWYSHITLEDMIEVASSPKAAASVKAGIEKGEHHTHRELLPRLTEKDENGAVRLSDDPPALFHLFGEDSLLPADDPWQQAGHWEALKDTLYGGYLKTLAPECRALLQRFTPCDLAFKVVGVGSVATRCLVLLLMDRHDKALFLQMKEARPSVLAPYVGKRHAVHHRIPRHHIPRHNGQRVVNAQRALQAASDPFLGWTTGPDGHQFYVRQLWNMKARPPIDSFNTATLLDFARACGWSLARAHANASGEAAAISAYLGSSDTMAEALVSYAIAYADQNQLDYDAFAAACRRGELETWSEEDFAARLG